MRGILSGFDVIVVGGGCAGLWAAVCSAREGASTLLLEKRGEIGDRIICAEGVGARGLGAIIQPSKEWLATSIDGAKLCAPDGRCFTIRQPRCGYILEKDRFLKALAELARKSGVSIRTRSKASLLGCGGMVSLEISDGSATERLQAPAIVAADGIKSEISRQAGILGNRIPDEIFSCAQDTVGGIGVNPNLVEFHFGSATAPGGYAWVFPKGETRANIGVGISPHDGNRDCATSYLARFRLRQYPGGYVERPIVGGVPSLRNPFAGCGKGIFTAGDAAGVADPISGAGIVPALESGAIAGKVAASYAKGQLSLATAEEVYSQSLRKLYRDRKLRFAIRKMMREMSDTDLSRLIANSAEFFKRGNSLDGDPINLVKFLIKAMPDIFRLVRHYVGV